MDPARLTAALWGNGYAPENDAISYGRQVDRAAARDELVKALGGTWPVQMAKSAVGAAALPGDVYAGRVDPMSQQGIERAADLAGFATVGGFPFSQPGAVGSAGGKLYHGSPRQDLKSLTPSDRGPLGPGVYTTSADNYAARYAGPQGKVYELADDAIDVFRGQGHRTDAEYAGWKSDVDRLKAAVEPEMRDKVLPIIDKMWSGDGYPMYARLRNEYGGDDGAQELFRRAGFKGLSGQVDGPETVLFDSVGLFGLGGK